MACMRRQSAFFSGDWKRLVDAVEATPSCALCPFMSDQGISVQAMYRTSKHQLHVNVSDSIRLHNLAQGGLLVVVLLLNPLLPSIALEQQPENDLIFSMPCVPR